MKKLTLTIAAIAVGLSFASYAVGPKGVSNIENQTRIYEGTSAGKAHANWSKGRTIEKGQSVQCADPALRRGSTAPNC